MKIKNATSETRSTWTGIEVNAGATLETDGMPDNEVEWLLRHGFKKAVKPKPKPKPVAGVEEVIASITPSFTSRRKRTPRK